MEDHQLGRRIAYWRARRGMTQQVFADRIDRSRSWVAKVEGGARSVDRLSVLEMIADVLKIDLQVLLGRSLTREETAGVDAAEVDAIRSALERAHAFAGTPTTGEQDDRAVESSVSTLHRQVTHAWGAFELGSYEVLGRHLPTLIIDTQAALTGVDGGSDAGRSAARVLAHTYLLTASALRKLGEPELSWLASDRALWAAERAEDPLLGGVAALRVGCALNALGRSSAAIDLHRATADRLMLTSTQRGEASISRLSVVGLLLLQTAMAAAREGAHAAMRNALDEADDLAVRIGSDRNELWTAFGPTNVAIHRTAAYVEIGDGPLAVDVAASLDPAMPTVRAERRAAFYLDLARGHEQAGRVDDAVRMLGRAEQAAPAEIRCRPLARSVIADLVRRSKSRPSTTLAGLATRAGVAA